MFFAMIRNNIASFCLALAAVLIAFGVAKVLAVCLLLYAAILVLVTTQTLAALNYTEELCPKFTLLVKHYGIRCVYDERLGDAMPVTANWFYLLLTMAFVPVLDLCAAGLNFVFRTERFGKPTILAYMDEAITSKDALIAYKSSRHG